LDENVEQKILFEIAQIDEIIDCTKPLRDLCNIKIPDIIEKSAVALLLQSFYNGIENILIIILKHFDLKLPSSSKWHLVNNIESTWNLVKNDLDGFLKNN
jgi:hypothetical protein